MEARTKADKRAIEEGCYYDPTEPDKVIKFYESFGCITENCHGGKVGDPVKIIPWQADLIRQLFGWRKNDGSRRFNELICFCPKKQNKSGLIALLSLYHIMTEPAALAYVIASKVDQARVCFNFAANTCRYGRLKQYIGKGNTKKTIWIRDNVNEIRWTDGKGIRNTVKVMPSTPEGVSGPSASLVVADEIAEWNATHAQIIWDRLAGAGAARSGLFCIISTPQFNKEHLGYHKWSYGKSILDGDNDDTTVLPVLYGVPEEAECICDGQHKEGWRCPSWWKRANPSMGITVPESFYDDRYEKVKNSPMEEAAFRTLYAGQWVGHTSSWLSQTAWSACSEQYTEEEFYSEDAIIGVDLARRHDLASYILAFKRDDVIYLLPRFYMPEEGAVKKEKTDRVPYRRWHQQGLITLTSSDSIDYQMILNDIVTDSEKFNILEVRYDPYGAESIRQALEFEHGLPCVEVKQCSSVMSSPTAELERRIIKKTLKHPDHPILNWNSENCTVREVDTDGRIMLDKRRSTNRIDGITASIIALSGWMAMEDDGDLMLPMLM